MKKLRLDPEELRVQAFTTGDEMTARGTVQGHYGTNHTNFGGDTCDTQSVDYTWCVNMICP